MGKASTQAKEYSKNIKEGTGTAQVYADEQKTLQQSIQNTGTASRVAAVGVKALSIAGNMLAGMTIAFAISKVIEGIKYLTTASERAIEKTKELQQEISQISSDYQSERQTLEGLREEYDALTSKIGENGAEASLSADEYERYRDITSEILGITPKLITGWDDEGRAISNKNGLLQQSINLLDEEYQKSIRNSTTKSKNEEIASGIIEQKKNFDNSGDTKTVSGTRGDLVWGNFGDYINEAVSSKKFTTEYDMVSKINKFVYGEELTRDSYVESWLHALQDNILSSQENFEQFANSLYNEDNPIYQWFTDEQIDELIRGADEYFQELARIDDEEQQYFQQYKDQLNLNAQAVGDAYSSLDEQTKTGITQMIDSFDYNDMTKEKFSDIATDLKDFVGKLSTDDTLRSYFNNLFKPMGEDESIEDYETRVKTGVDEITSYCESNYPAIKLSFGDVESDVEALKLKYKTAISKFTGDANDVDLGKFFEDNSINDESEIDYWNKVTDGAKSASEAVEMYNKVKSETFSNEITVSYTDSISNVEKLTKDLEQLQKVYQDVADKGEFDYSSILNNTDFKNAFGNYKEEYDAFIETITKSPNDIRACQSAFNELVSAYITGSGVLDNLTEETRKSTIALLEQKGISNATAIVDEKLRQKEAESTAQKILEKNATIDLTNATYDEIKVLMNEAGASADTRKELIRLVLQKQDLNRTNIVTNGSIQNLINLAEAANVCAKEVAYAKMAMQSNSTSFLSGIVNAVKKVSAYVQLRSKLLSYVNTNTNLGTSYNGGTSSYGGSYGGSSGGSSGSQTIETFNWIERAIKSVQNTIDTLSKTVSATYKTWSTRNKALTDEIKSINSEISLQQKAYDYYMKKANSVGLSSSYQKLVQNGSISIQDIKDEKLINKINAYQDFYDQALDCKNAIADLKDELANLARQKFDNVVQEYEGELSSIEQEINILDSSIEQVETRGYIVSKNYYSAIIEKEKANISLLQKQYTALSEALSDAMVSGNIAENSEEWRDMVSQIQDVKQSLVEANTSLIEYKNTMRELDWENFDRLQDTISQITEESDWLIDLMSNSKMYGDNGSITSEGQAILGLHAVNYNTYMEQAKDYANELLDINKQIAEDPNNQTLLERRQELLEAQMDMISSAESEKQAIKDLVSEGYDSFLESMNKIIDKRKEMLSQAKDLYDYERNISEQTKEIASLEKQLSAYQSDDSEESRATIQQLKVSLEESKQNLQQTEYDKYISDQEQMLDTLYSQTETWLNSRLDNLDGLIQEVIDSTNANAETIKETLTKEANDVGYILSQEMQNIWNGSDGFKNVVSMYGDNFTNGITTVNDTLLGIKEIMQDMISGSDKNASSDISSSKVPNISKPTTSNPPTNNSSSSSSTSKPSTPTTTSTTKVIKVGGKINAGSAKIYDYVGDKTGSNQYYKNDPIYTVLEEKNGYLKVRHHKSSSGVTGWFKKSDVKAYKTGGLVDYTGLAWVDGQKGKPEAFLNASDTELFAKLKDSLNIVSKTNMFDAIQSYAKLQNAVQKNGGYNSSGDVIFEKIEMYGVNDPQEFAKQIKLAYSNNTGNVRKMIKEDIANGMLGKNSLDHRKYL